MTMMNAIHVPLHQMMILPMMPDIDADSISSDDEIDAAADSISSDDAIDADGIPGTSEVLLYSKIY